eukprot:283800-Chlamydomonas_euryale.AAC.3
MGLPWFLTASVAWHQLWPWLVRSIHTLPYTPVHAAAHCTCTTSAASGNGAARTTRILTSLARTRCFCPVTTGSSRSHRACAWPWKDAAIRAECCPVRLHVGGTPRLPLRGAHAAAAA